MTLLRKALITLASAAAFHACTPSNGDSLTLAEDEYAAGRYESAQMICDRMFSTDAPDSLSINSLCRLAMLNAKLAEHLDENANIAAAARYFREAINRDSDSVAIFVETLEVEDRSRSAFITQLTQTIDTPADTTLYLHEFPDE